MLSKGVGRNCFPVAEVCEGPYAGTHGERGARAYNWGLGTEAPAGSWAESLVRGPLKLPFLGVLGNKVNHYNGGHYFKVYTVV